MRVCREKKCLCCLTAVPDPGISNSSIVHPSGIWDEQLCPQASHSWLDDYVAILLVGSALQATTAAFNAQICWLPTKRPKICCYIYHHESMSSQYREPHQPDLEDAPVESHETHEPCIRGVNPVMYPFHAQL